MKCIPNWNSYSRYIHNSKNLVLIDHSCCNIKACLKIGIDILCFGNSQWCLYNTQSKSGRMFKFKSRVQQADWLMILENNEKATLIIIMPCSGGAIMMCVCSWLYMLINNAMFCVYRPVTAPCRSEIWIIFLCYILFHSWQSYCNDSGLSSFC